MLVIQMGFPILDGITSLILTMLEAAKGYFSMKITEYNIKMKKSREEEGSVKNPIGFVYEEDLENEEIL